MGWLTNVEYQQTRTAGRDWRERRARVFGAKCDTPRARARTRAGTPKRNTSTAPEDEDEEIDRPATT